MAGKLGRLRSRCVVAVAALSVAGGTVETSAQTFYLDDDVAALVRERRARERLYRSKPAYKWHFQIDTNAGRSLVLAGCHRLACGAFYRSPPVRLTMLSMTGRPLMLSVVREDCLSAGETWRSSDTIQDVRRLPISMGEAQSTTKALIAKANVAARRNCTSKSNATAARTILPLAQLQSRFLFQQR
jgi:hypothetical protein